MLHFGISLNLSVDKEEKLNVDTNLSKLIPSNNYAKQKMHKQFIELSLNM